MTGAIVLVRVGGPDEDPFSRVTLYASTSVYDLLDEFQRLAHRVYALKEGEKIEKEARRA